MSRNPTDRLQERLEEQLRYEKLVAAVSTRFIDLDGERVDEEIVEVLSSIGRYFGADEGLDALYARFAA